jgi:hypothetical protein
MVIPFVITKYGQFLEKGHHEFIAHIIYSYIILKVFEKKT